MNIYFLGGGNMATAIAGGLVKQDGYRVHIVERGAERRAQLEQELGVATSENLPELSADDVLILAVKPQDMQAACQNIRLNGALVLSVAAGLSIDTLSHYLGGTCRIVRIMPNTPAKIGLGVSGMFADAGVSEADRAAADGIMRSVGTTVWLNEEEQLHNITGISGSGPAYVFYLLGALQNAALAQGFNEQDARELSLATFKGAVALAEQTGEAFAQLQQNVTSKGGTTHEAIETFKARHVAEAIEQGVEACVKRSQEWRNNIRPSEHARRLAPIIGRRYCHPVYHTLFAPIRRIGSRTPPAQIQHTGNRLADQTLAKSISIRRENRLVLPARRFSSVLPCLYRHYFHLTGAVHQQ